MRDYDFKFDFHGLSNFPQIRGILLCGSKCTEYHDGLSDFDFEVIIKTSDEYNLSRALNKPILNCFEFSMGSVDVNKVELAFVPQDVFCNFKASHSDVDRQRYQGCKVLWDPHSFIKNEIVEITKFDDDKMESRLKFLLFEFYSGVNNLKKSIIRGNELNARMTATQIAHIFVKLTYLLNRIWPPPFYWVSQCTEAQINNGLMVNADLLGFLREPQEFFLQHMTNYISTLLQTNGWDRLIMTAEDAQAFLLSKEGFSVRQRNCF